MRELGHTFCVMRLLRMDRGNPETFARLIGNAIMAHDRSKEFHWKFNRPVAAKMIQLQNPLLRFLKTTKGNFSGEDF